jgi:hypothetical protein
MKYGFAPAKVPATVSSLIVEDSTTERLKIRNKIGSSRVFNPLFYDNYRKGPFMQRAEEADIVSLDLEVENRKYESRYLCKEIKKKDPNKSIVFFTSNPGEVLEEPINFVLGKSPQVWESYDRLLMKIFVHDRSMGILRKVVDLAAEGEGIQEQFEEIREELPTFISSLQSIQGVFEKENKTTARRYRKLGKYLTRMYRVNGDDKGIAYKLHRMHQPLMGLVNTELAEIKQVEGVYVTTKLEHENRDLKQTVTEQSNSFVDDLGFGQKVIVSAADIASDVLKSISERLGGGKPAETTAATDESEPEEERSLYLNAFFPDYEDKEYLTVGVEAELHVNLDYLQGDDSMGISERLSSENAALLQEIGRIDVMLLCPEAHTSPVVETLELPPDPYNSVKFHVTPLQEGELHLTVVLLLRNESIHRTTFSCEATVAQTNAAQVAGGVVTFKQVEGAGHELENC